MKNQRGEATLFCVFILIALSFLLTLCALELERNFSLMKKRTELFLCVKETKGLLNRYLVSMGRTNWAIKNLNRARFALLFIPGFQGAALSADRIKKAIETYQDLEHAAYAVTFFNLHSKGCPLDPRLLQTPYKLKGVLYKRDLEGAAILRKQTWTYLFSNLPYTLEVTIDAQEQEAIFPKLTYTTKEKGEILSSLWSLR